MFISTRDSLHPNIIKTAVLIVSERRLSSSAKAFKSIHKLSLNSESNALVEIANVFRKNNISESAITEIFNDMASLILSLPNPEHIIGEYIYSNEVKSDIKRKIDMFNNNRNSYDLNSILNMFRDYIIRYSVAKYDWDTEGLKEYLGYAYANYFSKDPRYTHKIKEVLNNRGSVTKGNDGDISLSDKLSIETESKKVYSIDFPSIIKDISIASDRLFNISNVVVYDLFSFYKDETIKSSSKKIKELFIDCFGSLDFSPVISERGNLFDTKYTENTVNMRYLMLKRIFNNVRNGLFSCDVYSLYDEIKSIDMETLNSRNVATLFKHPSGNVTESKVDAMEKFNKELFLDVLKGVTSLIEFIKYLKYNNIEFSDSSLFRDLDNYKKFSTLESYLSIKDLSKEINEDLSSTEEYSLPYYDNNSLYEVLNGKYNLSSLSSIYNEQISKMYSPSSRTAEFKRRLLDFIEVTIPVKVSIDSTIEAIKSLGADVLSEEAFNCFITEVPNMLDLFYMYFDEGTPTYYLRDVLLEPKDIYNLLRFFDFTLLIYDHLFNLITLLELPQYDLLMSDGLHYITYPKDISSMIDLSKLKSNRFSLDFYKEESSEYVNDYYSISKFYSVLFSIISRHISDITDYIESRVTELECVLKEYGIVVVEDVTFGNVKLRSKLIVLTEQPENLTPSFIEFKNRFKSINGLLSEDGIPIVYDGYLIHEKGYMLSLASDFSVNRITEMQIFDLNKVKPWRDVLWKV